VDPRFLFRTVKIHVDIERRLQWDILLRQHLYLNSILHKVMFKIQVFPIWCYEMLLDRRHPMGGMDVEIVEK
jgi:hypothetical protein